MRVSANLVDGGVGDGLVLDDEGHAALRDALVPGLGVRVRVWVRVRVRVRARVEVGVGVRVRVRVRVRRCSRTCA